MTAPPGLSNDSGDPADSRVEIFLLSNLNNGVLASTAFYTYSCLLLSGQEIEYVWKHPTRPSSWLYVLIRYPALLAEIMGAVLNSDLPNCNSIAKVATYSETIAITATYLVQISRTYAVCGRKRSQAGVLTLFCIPIIAISTLTAIEATCANANPVPRVVFTFQIVLDIFFESFVIIATVQALWGTWSSRQTLAHSLLQDGLMYYIIFLVLQLSNLVSYNVKATTSVTELVVFSNQFSNTARWALTCQFILELRERSENLGSASEAALPTTGSFHTTIQFARARPDRDFGEPLVHPIHSVDLDDLKETDHDFREAGGGERTGREGQLREDAGLRECWLVEAEREGLSFYSLKSNRVREGVSPLRCATPNGKQVGKTRRWIFHRCGSG